VTRKGHVALGCRGLRLDDQMMTVKFAVMDTGIGIATMIFDFLSSRWIDNDTESQETLLLSSLMCY